MKKLSLFISILTLSLFSKAQTTPEINNVALFLQDGVEILDFAGPMEVFIQAGFNVFTVAETKEPIKAMGKLTIVPDYSIEDSPNPDMVAFFGGGGAASKAKKENIQLWVKKQVEEADLRFSVCTGAFFLGEVGLLDGQTATTFHSAIPSLQQRFPNAVVRDDVRYVDNGSVITTAGISAGIDGALHVVAKIKGQAFAQSVADNMEYFGWEPDKGLLIKNPFIQSIRENGLEKALKHADKNTVIYKGELLNLGHDFYMHEEIESAVAVYDHVANKYTLTVDDCNQIGKAYAAAGRNVPPGENEFLELVENGHIEKAYKILGSAKKEMPHWTVFREWKLNMIGYQLMGKDDFKKAIDIFKFNVAAFPDSFNTYDSLGEAYMKTGEMDLAIKNYKKSIELNPDNNNGKHMLEKINAERMSKNKSK